MFFLTLYFLCWCSLYPVDSMWIKKLDFLPTDSQLLTNILSTGFI